MPIAELEWDWNNEDWYAFIGQKKYGVVDTHNQVKYFDKTDTYKVEVKPIEGTSLVEVV